MYRKTSIFATSVFVLGLTASSFGQEPQIQPSPALPASVIGPQLIVWSQAQKPRPVPQPLPPPDQPGQHQNQPPQGQATDAEDQQQPTAQTFIGTIFKDGTQYVLKDTNGTAYQLDDQEGVKQYEGKPVKIVGSLNAKNNILHVVSIQLVS
jgi:hypothetical protein